jgi:LacI family transcriptional regulator
VTGRVTIADVAREAGVSSMTVSRVINNKGEVSEPTRQRVLSVIKRLDYRPSGIARGLATRRTGTLGLVIPDVANPFFADVVRGVEQVAYAHGYNVFLCNSEEDPQREMEVLQSLEEKRVDGLILCSSRLEDHQLRTVLERHSRVVLVNRQLDGEPVSSVVVDDATGCRLVVEMLLRAGHRAIGLLSGPTRSHSARERSRGYLAALAEAGLEARTHWMVPCPPTVDGGHSAALALLQAFAEITALVCYNDLVAVGVLQACVETGKSVPDQIAVVGYDDILLAALVTPALTTCHVPRLALGAQTVHLLLDQINGNVTGRAVVVLTPHLVRRASAP